MKRIATIALFFLFFTQAHAEKFIVGADQFSVNVPHGWTVSKDLFGFPVAMMGPDNSQGHRTVIGITPAGGADSERVFEKGDKDISSYKEGRERWLATLDGKSSSFDAYQKISWKGIEEAHALGFHYELVSGKFYERSVYALCNGRRVIHVNSLVLSEYEKKDNAIVDQTIKSLKCENSAPKGAKTALNNSNSQLSAKSTNL